MNQQPRPPAKEDDENYSYTFKGWDKAFDFITEDVEIHAVFENEELPPDDVEEPDDEKEPDDVEKPDDGKEPGDVEEPDDGKEPDDVEKPDNKKEPDDEKKPDDVEEPDGRETEEGKEPDNEKKPEDNKKPDNGKEPGEDKKPDNMPQDSVREPEKERITQTGTAPASDGDSRKEAQGGRTETKKVEKLEKLLGDTSKNAEESGHGENDREGREREKMPDFSALLFIVLLVVVFLLFLLFLQLCYGRRKICGKVLEHGEPMKNLLITLERTDIADREGEADGRNMWTARTDADGCFCFGNLAKGSYQVNFPSIGGKGVFSVDVDMEEKEENMFDVPVFCGGVETEKKGRKYVVDVKA